MEKRRQFLKKALKLIGGIAILLNPLYSALQRAIAQVERIILPKGTSRESLIDKNPAHLDTRNLGITDLKNFGTMGLSDHSVDLNKWRLQVVGRAEKTLQLKYEEILSMPSVEREVLLICPGFFANHGAWKGISIAGLLKLAGAEAGATHVTVHGPEGDYGKTQRYPIEDILSGKVFLAYQVNGQPLPRQHGFPLRAVAEGYYGNDWIKYVHKVSVDKV